MIELPSTDSPAKGALIVLHGWGANQHDLVPFVQNLGLKGTHSFFPDGLFDVPGTGGVGRGWFSFPLNENSERERMKSREMLFSLVNDVQKKGFTPKEIVLVGFSQGAGMCLDVMLHLKTPIGAVVALSGFLMDGEKVKSREDLPTETPIFAAHGLYDPILPLKQSKETLHTLKESGFSLTWKEYPIAHEISYDETGDICVFLKNVFGTK
ncbi:MAG TPA: dienelactone hydrolase family protein [Candidatus Marinimicrobia bacterium]|nr:dienelactone hydrolase family protein [Candidatus Neomarinimicrobiota bacterium]MDP7120766.1 dienelactone hydrolase family protein [Candidatus Neomarinimicrobiota bacterium]MDP7716669.1 dienelactone hydrolase family protein [Candidatus Neomarinimicrobiota bacterium]HJL84553.1 dienelactone hydrolase family protein [Candidatus Neomarinimicrobiota bacterium]HJM10526.1 dienelactone hydrolase family protein [Candidatus Neomarinimicrobiota bacterium]